MEEEKKLTINDLIEKAGSYFKNESDLEEIKKAYEYASKVHENQKRLDGSDYILHPLNVAYILTEIYADKGAIITALLHDSINYGNTSLEDIKNNFGEEVEKLVDGISKINRISLSADSETSISYYKKILVGLSGDVRIIMVKIAERLHNMRTLWVLPKDRQKSKAKETLDIIVPIAHRLGINHIKSELEDLCLKYYKPDVYNDILEKLSDSRKEMDKSVEEMKKSVSEILTQNSIPHEMKGRTKSVYSIYNKLCKGKTFNEIYDILALRFLVNTEAECYLALGLIHAKYKPVPKRFKDYIARPKENGYQSLHTTVFGVNGKLFEIQIRTYDMDKIAEYGLASHWSYKEHGVNKINNMELKLKSFRSILELNEEQKGEEDFVNSVKTEVLNEDNIIYVYTPKGDVFELPKGSTPIDFAYKVHTSVGHQMVGAIVNDSIVPLDYVLQDGDIVKINTSKNSSGPSKEWLNIAYTVGAKSKIKAFFSKIDKAEVIIKGKDELLKTIKRKKHSVSEILDTKKLNEYLENNSYSNEDDLYYEIGIGKVNPTSVIRGILNEEENENVLDKVLKYTSSSIGTKGDIIIDGIDNLKVSFGKCCMPVKGDDIVGYISTTNGITIHRKNCHNILDINERIINATWNLNSDNKYVTNIIIYTEKSDKVLLDIISKTSALNVSIKRINSIINIDSNTYDLDIIVKDKEMLEKYITSIQNVEDVISCVRGTK